MEEDRKLPPDQNLYWCSLPGTDPAGTGGPSVLVSCLISVWQICRKNPGKK